ncbi:MAG: DNA-3-methyladenine glycosylase I [Phycisphaerales bacterium]|nr:DNA-3-methyladenine glycosylase I [Phycisphaerales bacterium]
MPRTTTGPRCPWARTDLSIPYHDTEWGVPVHDDRTLFEFLVLEGAQAGLSWETILRKRARYREAFDGFDPARVARFTPARIHRLLADPGIVRNRLKVWSAVTNARAVLRIQKEFGSFDAYLWPFVGGTPIDGRRRARRDVPARTPESDALSKNLRTLGLRFVGSTICYAFMQAVGMVNDHLLTCPRHAEVKRHERSPDFRAPSDSVRRHGHAARIRNDAAGGASRPGSPWVVRSQPG